MAAWNNFFFAEVGASAALVGLIFVAVSINLTKILAYQRLPGRALEALIVLSSILIISSLMLVPNQPLQLLGIEVLVISVSIWLVVTRIFLRNYWLTDPQYRNKASRNIFLTQAALLPSILAGVILLVSGLGGLYLLVPAFIFSFIKGLYDAWVLLIEINR